MTDRYPGLNCIRIFGFRKSSECGQSLVEFAVTLPLLLLLVLGTIDLGMGFRTYIALTNAAREGARWVSINPGDEAGAYNRIANEAGQIGLSREDISIGAKGYVPSITPTTVSGMQAVEVRVDYEYELLFGSLTGLPTIPFTAQATMVVLYDE